MYKKKPTKSFFDSGDSNTKQRRGYFVKNKENIRDLGAESFVKAEAISEVTKTRLQQFARSEGLAERNDNLRNTDHPKDVAAVPSQTNEERQQSHSSQVEERVRWKLSPPALRPQAGSAQQLTINEMFDIFHASQHSSETPVRHIDTTNDLWSRYDSAEPLPYLNLDLSPATYKTPKSDAKLRRTTSLPTWSTDCRERKRRRTGAQAEVSGSGGRVRSMMEKVQQALLLGTTTRSESIEPREEQEGDHEESQRDQTDILTDSAISSDDFGCDELDEALLAKLPALQTPGKEPTKKYPLAIDSPSAVLESRGARREDGAQGDTVVAHADCSGRKCGDTSAPAIEQVKQSRSPASPGASSDYSLDFNEQDFLAASQLPLLAKSQSEPAQKPEEDQIAAELLAGLEDDLFSDFDDSPWSEDRSIYQVSGVQEESYRHNKRQSSRLLVTLRNTAGHVKEARFEDDWAGLVLEEGDSVRLHGSWLSSTTFVANNQSGLVIVHPDVLVSCTAVADSHTCMRKSVLQDRVRATSKLSKALLYGSVLHAILQDALAESEFSDVFLRQAIDKQIHCNIEKLYLIDESAESATDYLYSKILLLQQWASTFFGVGKRGHVEPMRGQGNLEPVTVGVRSALDIEERFWSPLFGLKGNVDVTAEFNVTIGSQESIFTAPLEFKTGKTAYQQSSYRAQVMLYTLMMSERYGVNVPAGFLYYLETQQITRVAALHNEIRGLIFLRNELAGHLKRKSMPPMISNKRLCGNCYASEACFIYHKSWDSGTGTSSRLEELFDGKTAHLGGNDVAFFNKWESLISKEEGEMFKYRHELWHMSSKDREVVNRCFSDLSIVPGSEVFDPTYGKMNSWTYVLQRASPGPGLKESQITDGEPIIVSDEEGRYAISCGFVVQVDSQSIVIQVDRCLRDSRKRLSGFDEFSNQVFLGSKKAAAVQNNIRYRIDRDEFKNGMGMVRNNIIALLVDPASKNASTSTERQRNLIVDLVSPKFDSITARFIASQADEVLNIDQLKAKNKILSAKDYALILGMPGTGKTTTIARIIRSLVAAGQSVLLTSYTHSAVDTILMKLAPHKISILRLGSYSKIHPEVVKSVHTERHDCKTFAELDHHYNSPNVVATTCLSINHAIFEKRRFDYCIFDEASQATLPVCLGPLRFADKFVLVGDHYQLPPLVKDVEARKGGLDVSLFKILCEAHPDAVVELQHQYRMNADIMSVANELIYNHRLTCGTHELEKKRLEGVDLRRLTQLHRATQSAVCPGHAGNCWLQHVIDPSRSVIYVNTDQIAEAQEDRSQDQIINRAESIITSHIVEALLCCGLRDLDIGVISPYRSQLKVIKKDLRAHPDVTVDTADKFQGRDKECIIVSLVRSNPGRTIGELLKDWRRINVALTRAKAKMIVIGSQDTLANDALLNAFLHLVHRKGWAYDLPPDALVAHPSITTAVVDGGDGNGDGMGDEVAHTGAAAAAAGKADGAAGKRQVRVVTAGKKVLATNRPLLRDLMNAM